MKYEKYVYTVFTYFTGIWFDLADGKTDNLDK